MVPRGAWETNTIIYNHKTAWHCGEGTWWDKNNRR